MTRHWKKLLPAFLALGLAPRLEAAARAASGPALIAAARTGDNSVLWIVLAVVSGVALAAVVIYEWKHAYRGKH